MLEINSKSNLNDVLIAITDEYNSASKKFPDFHSAHEGYGVILEEVDEMWDEIKANNILKARRECIQVAAMAIRFLMDIR